jgi:hypothetical protein
MRVLLLHADDVPWRGPWATTRWDQIVDLAYAGSDIYAEWTARCGSPVRSIHEFAGECESYASVKTLLDPGRNQLVDRMGLDWWEIIAVLAHHELQALYLLEQLRGELGSQVEYHATRAGTFSNLLSQMIGSAVPAYEAAPTRMEALARALRSARKLRPEQVTEIALDKWDASYSFRRLLAKSRRANCQEPVVLLPSSYSNVTRILLAYARDLPQRNFLLASTRRGGSSKNLPGNVAPTSLAAYALRPAASEREVQELMDRWSWFERQVLGQCDELRQARDAGVWRDFPAHLRRGIRLRNAWHELIKAEPVSAVFCADDLNYYTRIPLMLARNMGLNAVYCCHGALDGGMLFKQPYANRYLVKGEMERDYLLRCSTIDPDLVEIGAPSSYAPRAEKRAEVRAQDIVFFSQPYEVLAGRTAEIYRELLPKLCALARLTGHKVILKLHPFESVKDRKRLLNSVLSQAEISLVQVIAQQPLTDLLTHAWFGIGVDSSVAVECALAGVPYFLCGWLDHSGFGYGQQLARYGVGRMLHTATEIAAIPELIGNCMRPELTRLSPTVDKDVLDGMLFAHSKVSLAC